MAVNDSFSIKDIIHIIISKPQVKKSVLIFNPEYILEIKLKSYKIEITRSYNEFKYLRTIL